MDIYTQLQDKIKEMFKAYDENGDEQISKEEFFSHMDEVLDMMAVHQLLDPYVTKAV